MNNVLAASRMAVCLKCSAAEGDPCRTPAWRTTRPHKGRRMRPDGALGVGYLGPSGAPGPFGAPLAGARRR